MNCPDDELFVAMVHRTMEPGLLVQIEEHIDACEACRKALAALATQPIAIGTPDVSVRSDALVDRTIGDRYVIQSVLGRGGMGTVYLARDRSLGRDVALKLHKTGSGGDRLHREAVAMAQLSHPNVVTVYEVGTLDDRLYVAMEYVRGGTLRSWFEDKPRSWREIIAMLVETGSGLVAAHAAGLVHRDFKPENVLVGEDGRPRVGDFGLARLENTTPNAAELGAELTGPMTVTGTVLGTPAYMAPEQFTGARVDARCDQFAFCIVAWELLYGARPFAGTTIESLRDAIARHELRPIERNDVPDRVRRVIDRGLSVAPRDRYADMSALRLALREAAKPRTRKRLAAAAAATIVLGGAALLGGNAYAARHRIAECDAAGDNVRATFGAPARAELARAFAATGSAMAPNAIAHTTAAIDRTTTLLASQTVAACRADAPPLRRACLAGRNAEVRALLDVLDHADARGVLKGPTAAWAMFDPLPCVDEHAAKPPSDPVVAARLARVQALVDASSLGEGTKLAREAVAAAHAAGDDDTELAAQRMLGQLTEDVSPEDGMAAYHAAEALAEKLGRDADAALALSRLAAIDGLDKHDYVAAHRELDLARAKLQRLGGNPVLGANVDAIDGQILYYQDRSADAEAAILRADAALQQAYGGENPRYGMLLGVTAQIQRALDKAPEALATARHCLSVLRNTLGDDHPSTAGAEMTIGQILTDDGRGNAAMLEEAAALLDQARSVFEEVYGPKSLQVSQVLSNIGFMEIERGKPEQALADFRQQQQIVDATVGPRSPEAADVHHDIAHALAEMKHFEEAYAEVQTAIDLFEASGPAGAPQVPLMLETLGELDLDMHRPARAEASMTRALAIDAKLGDGANPYEIATLKFVLGRSHWGKDPVRAKAEILAVRATAQPQLQKEIDAWLADPKKNF